MLPIIIISAKKYTIPKYIIPKKASGVKQFEEKVEIKKDIT
jgi:hypothetical protein